MPLQGLVPIKAVQTSIALGQLSEQFLSCRAMGLICLQQALKACSDLLNRACTTAVDEI